MSDDDSPCSFLGRFARCIITQCEQSVNVMFAPALFSLIY